MRCGAMNRSNDRLDDGNLAGQLFDLEGLELRGAEKKALKEGQRRQPVVGRPCVILVAWHWTTRRQVLAWPETSEREGPD